MEGGWKQVLFLFWYRSSMKRKKYKCAENFSTLLMVEGIVSGERISLKRSVSERYRITLVTVARDTFFCVYFNSMFGGDGSRLVGPRQACLNFTRILSSISTKPDIYTYIFKRFRKRMWIIKICFQFGRKEEMFLLIKYYSFEDFSMCFLIKYYSCITYNVGTLPE